MEDEPPRPIVSVFSKFGAFRRTRSGFVPYLALPNCPGTVRVHENGSPEQTDSGVLDCTDEKRNRRMKRNRVNKSVVVNGRNVFAELAGNSHASRA